MSEGFVNEAFETTSGDVWYRASDSEGRTYRVKKGEGRVSQEQYKAAKSHRPEVAIAERGESVQSATEGTQTYDSDLTVPTMGLDRGSEEYRLGVNRNRFLGFADSDSTPDDRDEAIREYANMINELKDADSRREREGIREAYGLGGS